MPKPIELHYWPTPNGWKITMMLEECGLPYEVKYVNINKGDQFKPDFLAIAPNNRMPAIVDPDGPGGKPLMLSQSGAILLYAAEKTGRFLPRELAARAIVMQWFCSAISDAAPAGTALYYANARLPEKSEANTAFFERVW